MSHRVNITFPCPRCKHEINAEIYRSIWGEKPENRELVFSDKINRIPCPKCGVLIFPNTSLMYTHVVLKFAVWFEPVPDPSIDAGNAMMPNTVSYLRNAKRIRDWNEFKATIVKHENGTIVTENVIGTAKGKGCMVFLAFLAFAAASVVIAVTFIVVR